MADEYDLTGPITIDLGEIRDEPVEDGWHHVTIERTEPKLSRQQKLPEIFVLSRIVDEADPDHNNTILWNSMLDGDGMKFTKRCFAALGLPEKLNYPTAQDLADDMLGREVMVKTKQKKQDDGEVNVNVTAWKPVEVEQFEF